MAWSPRIAVLLAVLLAGGLVGATPTAHPAQSEPALQPTRERALLSVNETARGGFAQPSLDVGVAIATRYERSQGRLATYAFEEATRRADTATARRQLLRTTVSRLEAEVVALQRDARALRTAYARREITTAEYLRRRALLRARAAALEGRIINVSRFATSVPDSELRERLGAMDETLLTYRGPVQARVTASLSGRAPPIRIHAIAAPNGSVLSMIEDERYRREAVRADRQTPDADLGYGINQVVDRVQSTLYPTYFLAGITGLPTYVRSGIYYRIDIESPGQTVAAYLDTGTRDVFYEVRTVSLTRSYGNDTVRNTANGTRLIVNRTYAGGPLRIATYDNATRSPVDVAVDVGGVQARTGPDGVVWVLAPTSPVRITAVRSTGNVSVLVQPLRPPPVDGDGGEG